MQRRLWHCVAGVQSIKTERDETKRCGWFLIVSPPPTEQPLWSFKQSFAFCRVFPCILLCVMCFCLTDINCSTAAYRFSVYYLISVRGTQYQSINRFWCFKLFYGNLNQIITIQYHTIPCNYIAMSSNTMQYYRNHFIPSQSSVYF